jgi:outer membrane protein OmpA-like peptidoglycan-associated protein
MQSRILILALSALTLSLPLSAQTTKPNANKPTAGTTKPTASPPKTPKMAVINLTNPSFEDTPHAGERGGSAPTGWYDCGSPTETPPDVQPGFFGIFKPASHGTTYMGLVVRDNETWEGVSQRLSQPLVAGNCYEFDIDLCRSEEYSSPRGQGGPIVSFGSAVQVRVWGGNGFCDRAELLYTTPYVVNTRWLGYTMSLKPEKGNYSFILIEAYFKTPQLFPYNGNVLVDNARPIRQVACNQKPKPEPPPPVTNVKPTDKPGSKPPTTTTTKTPPPPPPAPPKPDGPKTVNTVDPNKLRKGDVLQIQNLYFDADKSVIKNECIGTLTDVYNFLKRNPKVIVEIGGHTNNRPSDDFANRLSTERAKAVYDWLVAKGIPADRLQYKGYGKTLPLIQNTTEEGRKKNQRVEIKILSVG